MTGVSGLISKRQRGLQVLMATALVMGTMAWLAPPAESVVSGTNGRIFYASDQTGDNEIYVVNDDQTMERRLTNSPGSVESDPAISPTANKIAFVSDMDFITDYDIYVMDPDGTDIVNLTGPNGFLDRDPVWSPDGTQIAFISDQGSGPQLFVMDADGSNQTEIDLIPASYPSWSPDGSTIAFQTQFFGTGWDIATIPAAGGPVVQVTDNTGDDEMPSWSPSVANELVYVRGATEVIRQDASLGATENLLLTSVAVTSPSYSPSTDPGRIVYADGGNLFTMDSFDGANNAPLVVTPGLQQTPEWGVQSPAGVTFMVNVGGDAAPDAGGCDVAHCNLREAITDANAMPNTDNVDGRDDIRFLSSPFTVLVTGSELPAISDPVTLVGDVTDTGGFTDQPEVEIVGGGLSGAGLTLTGGDNEIFGLNIGGFAGNGITISGPGGNVITDVFIGVNHEGDGTGPAYQNTGSGININGSDSNIVTDSILSANGDGISLVGGAVLNQVLNSHIGTDLTGVLDLGNSFTGVVVESAGNLIQGNIIGGNNDAGIEILGVGADSNQIDSNYIGKGASGGDLHNDGKGIYISDGNDNEIFGNFIRFNLGAGTAILSGTGNTISGNSISENFGQGIDLGANSSQSVNDALDADTGEANEGQNYPGIISADPDTGRIYFELHSAPSSTYVVEFFSDDTCETNTQGNYMGGTSYGTDASGDLIGLSPDFSGQFADGEYIFATATDVAGNTSEFSITCVQAAGSPVGTTVNSTADGADVAPGDGFCETSTLGQCTLRAAIEEANALPGTDTIDFEIPGTGVHTISPASPLPIVTETVIINGTTEDDWVGASGGTPATLLIEIDGSGCSPSCNGLQIDAADSKVTGIAIYNFISDQIYVNADRVTVSGNHIGTDTAGITGGGGQTGVRLNSWDNVVGGSIDEDRNVISDNTVGIRLSAVASDNNVQGNYIGTDGTGTSNIGNTDGILVNPGSTNNVIGGSGGGAGNLISGNTNYGIQLASTGNFFNDNYVGTDRTGALPIPNGTGVYISGDSNAFGSAGPLEGNLVSGNTTYGILIDNGDGNSIDQNLIGTDATGTLPLPNGFDGIRLSGNAAGNFIGGPGPAGNLISGNDVGIQLNGPQVTGNSIRGNLIGTDASGSNVLPNDSFGVRIANGAGDTLIGGPLAGERNVISGNGEGVVIEGAASGNTLEGNLIGTDASGTGDLGNTFRGVVIGDTPDVTVGSPGAGNTIGFNTTGIALAGPLTMGTLVQGNNIGTDSGGTLDLGQIFFGIEVTADSTLTTIGGTGAGEGNLVANNGSAGIVVDGASTQAKIRRNLVWDNVGIGIALGAGDVITANDPGDVDTGPNDLQNFPELTDAYDDTGTATISYELDSTPGTDLALDFFRSAACDGTGYGEGAEYIGSALVNTTGDGTTIGTSTFPSFSLSAGDAVTSTATDPSGNTSEFSNCWIVGTPPAPANDDFVDAIEVFGDAGTTTGTNVGATPEIDEPTHADFGGGQSVWYMWTATFDGTMTFETTDNSGGGGTDFDTVLGIYTEVSPGVSNLFEEASNDDSTLDGSQATSRASFNAVNGTEYFIAVDGYNNAAGNFVFEWNDAPGGDDIVAPIVLASFEDGTTGLNTSGATKEALEPDHGNDAAGGASVWYSFPAPSTGTYTFDCTLDFGCLFTVYEGTDMSDIVPIGSDPGPLGSDWQFEGTSGNNYLVVVDVPGAETGAGDISWSFTPPLGPPNDNIANAEAVTVPDTVSGTNIDATGPEVGEPAHAGAGGQKSVWYTFQGDGGVISVDTFGTLALGNPLGDTVLAAYTMPGYVEEASNDDFGGTLESCIEFTTTLGEDYFVAVDGYNAVEGDFVLNLNTGGCPGSPPPPGTPPANDQIANAEVLSVGSVNGTNINATGPESGEPAHAGAGGFKSVWYTFPGDGTVMSLDTFGTLSLPNALGDTVLGAYTMPGYVEEASNDDFGGTLESCVEFATTLGEDYFVAVDGYNAREGDFVLSLNNAGCPGAAPPAAPPTNDAFSSPVDVLLSGGGLGVAYGTNVAASKVIGEPDHGGNPGGASVWYTVTPSATGPIAIDTFGTAAEVDTMGDTLLGVYQGADLASLTPVAGNDDADGGNLGTVESCVDFTATAGQKYRIAVDGYNNRQGQFVLNVNESGSCPTATPPPPPAAPGNDMFADAKMLASDTALARGTNVSATSQDGEPAHAFNPGPGRSVWYQWTPPSTSDFVIRVNGVELPDSMLAVYAGDSLASLGSPLAFNDDTGTTLHSCLTITPADLTPLKIAVDGYAGQMGDFELRIEPGATCGDASADEGAGDGDSTTGTVDQNGTLTTDGTGDGTGPGDPQETSVTSPNSGEVAIEENDTITNEPPETDTPLTDEYTFFGQEVQITAPEAKEGDPLQIVFLIDASAIPDGVTEANIQIFRTEGSGDPEVVPNCTPEAIAAGVADPAPCVAKRVLYPSGDIEITVFADHASRWNQGLRAPRQISNQSPSPSASASPSPSASASPSSSASPSASASPAATQSASPPPPGTIPQATLPPSTGPSASPSSSSSPGSSPSTGGQLDTTPPSVNAEASGAAISPNGDGRSDSLKVMASFSEPVSWTFTVLPTSSSRQSETPAFTSSGQGTSATITWDGKGVPDGVYMWRLTATDAAGNSASPASGPVVVDTVKPQVDSLRTRPSRYDPTEGKLKISFDLSEDATIAVKIMKLGKKVARTRFDGQAGDVVLKWNGKIKRKPAAPGSYVVKIVATDAAGNKQIETKEFKIIR